MKSISMLIKPASSSCNLRCRYCFYHDVSEKRKTQNYGMMTEATLENLVKRGLESAEYSIIFAFQGGEPTLRGLDFYKKFHEYVQRYNTNNILIQYSLQTNGTLINDEWADFFHQHNYLVGLSLDGPQRINDGYRLDAKDKGTYHAVMRCAKILNRHKVEFNILSVINKLVAKDANAVYKFFRNNNFAYIQFIACLDELGEIPGSNPYSLTPEDYGKFLTTIFKLWYNDMKKGHIVSIRMFENILSILLGLDIESCDMRGTCSPHAVVEADGSVFPCDFYVVDAYRLGNINEQSLESMLANEVTQNFVTASTQIPQGCANCTWNKICRGGCRRHRYINEDNLYENYFCKAYQDFYSNSLPYFKEIALNIKSNL